MKRTATLVVVFAVITAISSCRDKESRTQAAAAAGDRSASQGAPSTNKPVRADNGPAPGTSPHKSDAELLQNMK